MYEGSSIRGSSKQKDDAQQLLAQFNPINPCTYMFMHMHLYIHAAGDIKTKWFVLPENWLFTKIIMLHFNN